MFRLQVWYGNRWKWGIVEYDSIDAANARVAELNRVGIKSRVRKNEELFT